MSTVVFRPKATSLSLEEPKKDEAQVSVIEIAEPLEEAEVELTYPTTITKFDPDVTHIQSSPYADPVNFLNLMDLGLQDHLMALAMTHFRSSRPDFATAPYMEAFNWPVVFRTLKYLCLQAGITWKRQEFYVVIFRSQLKLDIDRDRLGELDKMSHEEACASGGLLHYWFGSPNAERRNLATCIWRNRADAQAGGRGPWHAKAMGAAREMYESISFHRHKFVVGDNASTWCIGSYRG